MFYNNKIILFSLLLIFSTVLLYLVSQQIVLVGILSNFFISLLILYLIIIIISAILSITCLQLYVFFSNVIKCNKCSKILLFWWLFTIFSYIVSFIIFMFTIEY